MKRTGRPPKEPVPGTRHSLGLKVTADIKSKLDKAARESGRTQSQQAEHLLERSFDRVALLPEVLSLNYGKELGGLVMLLGTVMIFADCFQQAQSGPNRDWKWGDKPDAYDAAVQAAVTVLEAARPEGMITDRSGSGVEMADVIIGAVRGDSDAPQNPFTEDAPEIRELLGPIAERLRRPQPVGDAYSRWSQSTRFCPRCELPVSGEKFDAILSEVKGLVAQQLAAGLPLEDLAQKLWERGPNMGCPLCSQLYQPRVEQNIAELLNGYATLLGEPHEVVSANSSSSEKARGTRRTGQKP